MLTVGYCTTAALVKYSLFTQELDKVVYCHPYYLTKSKTVLWQKQPERKEKYHGDFLAGWRISITQMTSACYPTTTMTSRQRLNPF